MEGHTDAVSSVAFSSDGKYVVSASRDKTVRLWDVAGGQEVKKMEGHTDAVTSVAFSSDGKYVVSASWDKTVRLWDVAGGQEVKMEGHTADVSSVAFSSDCNYVVSASVDKTVRLWDFPLRQPQQSVVFGRNSFSVPFLGVVGGLGPSSQSSFLRYLFGPSSQV